MPIEDFARPLVPLADDEWAHSTRDMTYGAGNKRKELEQLIQQHALSKLFGGQVNPQPPLSLLPQPPGQSTVSKNVFPPNNSTDIPKNPWDTQVNSTEAPGPWKTNVIPGDPGQYALNKGNPQDASRFAQPNLNPLNPLFSPMGQIEHLKNRIGEIGYEHIQKPLERWEQSANLPGPHGTDERTDATLNIVKNLLGVGTATGVAEGVGATGSRIVQRTDAMSYADKLIKQGKSNSEIAGALNERFAPLLDEGTKVTEGMIAGIRYRTNAKAPRDYKVGAFGGRGGVPPPPKLPGTNTTAENLDWLQKQRPVDEEWVKQWAKDANTPIKREYTPTNEGAKYIEFESPNPLKHREQQPMVRLPPEDAHWGRPVILNTPEGIQQGGAGSRFDTGFTPGNKGIAPGKENTYEYGLLNQSGISYANPEALDAALKWRLHKAPPKNPLDAPGSGNWLIPEDMAPRLPQRGVPEPPKLPSNDPNQLNLNLQPPKDTILYSNNTRPISAIARSTFTPEIRQHIQALDRTGEGQPKLPIHILYKELSKSYPGHTLPYDEFYNLVRRMRYGPNRDKVSSFGAGPDLQGNNQDAGFSHPSLNDYIDDRQQQREYDKTIEDYERSLRGLPPVKQPYQPPPGHKITDDEVMKIIQRYAHAR